MKIWLSRLLIITLMALLLVVPGYWSSRKGYFPDISLYENRNLAVFPEMGYENFKITAWLVKEGRFHDARVYFLDQFTKQTFQQDFVQAATDQFPFRLNLTRIAKLVDRVMIRTTYTFLPDTFIPTDISSGIFISKDGTTSLKGITGFNQGTMAQLDERLKMIKKIKRQHPEINIYIFYIDNLAYSKFDPRLPTFTSLDGGRAFEYFEQNLPEGIQLGKFMLTSLADQNLYYFHTDHHLNVRGSWQVYQSLYKLIQPNYPGMSPLLEEIRYETRPDLKFLGTYARDALYPFQPELFEMGHLTLPPHTIIHDEGDSAYSNSAAYLSGHYSLDPYASHFQEFYGKNPGYVTYSFENDATRNLLLFGSSQKIPLQPWIASHFNDSYFINLSKQDDFSLEAFLEEHRIDDLVILTDMNELLDNRFIINP